MSVLYSADCGHGQEPDELVVPLIDMALAHFEGPLKAESAPAESQSELRGLLDLLMDDRLKQLENEALAANDLRLYQEVHARRKARKAPGH